MIEADVLEKLKQEGILGSAVISRDGIVLNSDLPPSTHEETFAIMCATIVGAANTANKELDRSSPEKVIIDAKEGRILIVSAGRNKILSVLLDSTHDIKKIFQRAKKIASEIEEL
ncbi:MAG: roadblock/LC7 domain-containing protein [Thermoplasmatota archaeon]